MINRWAVVALAGAAFVWLPAASATGKSYTGPAQLDVSLSAAEARAEVYEWCVRKWPDLAKMTPGVLFLDDDHDKATLTLSSAEQVGVCGFEDDHHGNTYRGNSFTNIDRSALQGGKLARSWYTSGQVAIVRVAPDVVSLDLRLADGRTVAAAVEGETAVLVVPDEFPMAGTKGTRMIVKDAAGAVLEDKQF